MLSGRSPGPSLYGPTEGSASEAADVRLASFGLSRGLSAAAESAFPEGAIASILRDASGGKHAAEPMFAYEDRKVPGEEKVCTTIEGRCGESRGRRLTDAGIRTRRCPDICGAWQAVTTTPAGLGRPGGLKASSRQRPIDCGRKALFPETRVGCCSTSSPL